MDLFKKCQDFTLVKEIQSMGIYPYFVMKTFPQKGATIRPVQGQAVYTIGNMDSGGARQGIRLPTQRFQTF